VKKLRGEIALAKHLSGEPLAKVAKDFGVSKPTIRKDINDAIRGELFRESRDFIQGTLVPKALKVIDTALDAGDTETARWVAERTAFSEGAAPYGDGTGTKKADSFEEWRLSLVRRKVGLSGDTHETAVEGAGAARLAGSSSLAVDAEVVSEGDRPDAHG
jgi:hypothetical protein